MVTAELTETSLTIDGTNKAARIALFGSPKNDGPRQIPRASITRVTHKAANPMVNGNLIVHTDDGAKYQLHFRRKSRDQFAALAAALGA